MKSKFIVLAAITAGLLAAQAGPQSLTTISSTDLACTTSAGAGTFAVQGWSLGATLPVNIAGGASSASRVQISGLQLVKVFDECSASLFAAVTSGKHLNTVTLTQTEPSGNGNLRLMTIQLSGVYVSGYQLSGSTTSAQPAETIILTFSQIVIQNVQNNSHAGWNLLTGTAI